MPAGVEDNDVIRDNIIRILQTMKGSRVMRPETGSNVWNFVFESIGPVLTARMDHEVRRAIAQGEPRATVLNVAVTEEERQDGGKNIIVTVAYRVNLDVQQASAAFSQPTPG